jgi:hypothetical protein
LLIKNSAIFHQKFAKLDKTTIIAWDRYYGGVIKKHNFGDIQQKIPQISDFAKKRDSNPLPHGDIVADIAKMFSNFFFAKIGFRVEKHNFCNNPIGFL